jgi:hypothetical protein
VILTNEEGDAYRLVGTARENFVTAADPEDEFALESGFFAFKANLIGAGGLFGTIDFLPRRAERQRAHSGSEQLSLCVAR